MHFHAVRNFLHAAPARHYEGAGIYRYRMCAAEAQGKASDSDRLNPI